MYAGKFNWQKQALNPGGERERNGERECNWHLEGSEG